MRIPLLELLLVMRRVLRIRELSFKGSIDFPCYCRASLGKFERPKLPWLAFAVSHAHLLLLLDPLRLYHSAFRLSIAMLVSPFLFDTVPLMSKQFPGAIR